MKDLAAHSFTIANRKFESTVGVKREHFEDDRLGVVKPMFEEMGHLARQHPDELVFGLLRDGFTSECFDGQFYVDTDHPSAAADGTATTVSNDQDGTAPAWVLLDTSRAVRPLVWQERYRSDFQSLTRPDDDHVFMKDRPG